MIHNEEEENKELIPFNNDLNINLNNTKIINVVMNDKEELNNQLNSNNDININTQNLENDITSVQNIQNENDNNKEEKKTYSMCMQIKIDNFHKLSETEVLQIVHGVMEDLENVEITSIIADENNIVDINFKLIDFNMKEFIHNYLIEKNENIKQIASELNFNNCKEIENIIGKPNKIKKDDSLLSNCENCFVCFEKYQCGELKRELPKCKHFFHKKCIDKWLKKKAQCPICRDNVLEEHIQQIIHEKAKNFGLDLNSNSEENI